ncbi:MAG: DUF2817 domain-containing protein [Phycisphaerae bacterium]|nr:DUF2817 domain-containing protein [Phycisphaerae bacterium]
MAKARWPLVAFVVLLAGCKPPDERLQAEPVAKHAADRVEPRRLVLGSSVEGRPIECLVFGQGEDVVLIMATIHGSEPAGTPLVRRLAGYLPNRPDLLEDRQILLIPVANPDGMARGTRFNARNVDLNRNFPASNYRADGNGGSTPLSEPESLAIHDVLETYHPDRIVSIHQPMNYGDACVDYDGPGAALARAMASQAELPVEKLGGQPGSLGSYAGITLGIPIITVELPKVASSLDSDTLWTRYASMLLAAICFPEPMRADVGR